MRELVMKIILSAFMTFMCSKTILAVLFFIVCFRCRRSAVYVAAIIVYAKFANLSVINEFISME